MARPIWKGYITFGLVNIPVILFSAEKKFDIQLKLIDSRDKAKIHYMRINEQTGAEVPWNKVAKGYEYDENNFIVLKQEDLNEIAGEHSKTIDIINFVEKSSLSFMEFDKPYYLVPDKKNEKGYVILREVLQSTNKIGISKVVIHTREYLAALIPYNNALVLNLLRYSQELRKPSEFEFPEENIKKYKVTTKELDIAKQLVASMTKKWKPSDYHDEFRETLHKWIEDQIKHKGKKSKKKSAEHLPKSNVINFMDLLKKSLKTKKPTQTHKPAKKSHPTKRAK